MTWESAVVSALNYLLSFCIKYPFISIGGLFVFLLISLLISHWFDSAEGTIRNKILWIIFMLLIAAIVLIILLAFKGGTLSISSLIK